MEFIQRVYVVVECGAVLSNGAPRLSRMVLSDREDINPKKHYRDGHAINAALGRLLKRCNEEGFFLLHTSSLDAGLEELEEHMVTMLRSKRS